MKRNKRRLPIPQHEFGFVPETFNLMLETALDGDRLSRERDQADDARRLADAAQVVFFNPNTVPINRPNNK
ncbi:MAG TPA: hypothetical protein VFC44_22435 [Candidatus Saccharimonadales bacterium]|nr:hypothetical protein [Candidatus Saccharimonadales bacterium]